MNVMRISKLKICAYLVLFIFILSFASCRTIHLNARKGKDLQLTVNDISEFKGVFTNIPNEPAKKQSTLFCLFTKGDKDTTCRQQKYKVKIASDKNRKLILSLDSNGKMLKTLTLKGKFKNGYFKVNRKFDFIGLLGPLFWVFGTDISYVGLTNDNDLVVLNSAGTGVLFVIVMPISVSGGDQQNMVYKRVE